MYDNNILVRILKVYHEKYSDKYKKKYNEKSNYILVVWHDTILSLICIKSLKRIKVIEAEYINISNKRIEKRIKIFDGNKEIFSTLLERKLRIYIYFPQTEDLIDYKVYKAFKKIEKDVEKKVLEDYDIFDRQSVKNGLKDP